MELQLSSDSELQLLAIRHIDFFFFKSCSPMDLIIYRPLAKCIIYLNLICHCNHPPFVILLLLLLLLFIYILYLYL